MVDTDHRVTIAAASVCITGSFRGWLRLAATGLIGWGFTIGATAPHTETVVPAMIFLARRTRVLKETPTS
jgi:hypothetical protein